MSRVMLLLMVLGLLSILFACEEESPAGCVIDRGGLGDVVVGISGDCSGRDFRGVDLSDAKVKVYDWTDTVCPDGTLSADHNDTCLGHLSPGSDVGLEDVGLEDIDSEMDVGVDMETGEDIASGDMPEDLGPCQTPESCFQRCLGWKTTENPVGPVSLGLPEGDWTLSVWLYFNLVEEAETLTLLQLRTGEALLLSLEVDAKRFGDSSIGKFWMLTGTRNGGEPYLRTAGNDLHGEHWHHVAMDSSGAFFLDGEHTVMTRGGTGSFGVGGSAREVSLLLGVSPGSLGTWRGSLRELYIMPGLLPEDEYNFLVLRDMPQNLPGYSWGLEEDETNRATLRGRGASPDLPVLDAAWGPCLVVE